MAAASSRSLRRILASLLGLVAILGLISGALALLGQSNWSDVGWYFHAGPDYTLHRGQEALRRGDLDLVERLALFLERDGFLDHAALLRGRSFFEQGKSYAEAKQEREAQPLLYQALQELSQIQDQGSLRREAIVLSGLCYLTLKQSYHAEQAFTSVLTEQPDHIEAHRGLAVIYFDQGALNRALAHLEKVAELDPSDGRPHRLIGLIHKDLEHYGPAAEAYQEALRRGIRGQNLATVRQEWAECLVKQAKFAAALTVLEQFEPLPDDAALVEALRAECLAGLGQTDQAQAVLDRALEFSPQSGELLLQRAKLYLHTHQPKAAIPLVQRALRTNPHDYGSRYHLVLAYRAGGQRTEANEQQRLLDQTQHDLAKFSELNREAGKRPWDASVREQLVALSEKLGKREMADMWRQAAAACPPAP
jgi:tetratricopeptide (TPR) repeat protein